MCRLPAFLFSRNIRPLWNLRPLRSLWPLWNLRPLGNLRSSSKPPLFLQVLRAGILAAVLLGPRPSWGLEMQLRGYAESRYAYLFGIDMAGLCGSYAPGGGLNTFCNPQILINRVRPSALVKFNDKASIRVTANVLTTHLGLERPIQTIWDILTVDRVYLEVKTKYIDFRLGKQSFEWGPAVIWNLTAPLNQQNLFEPNAERPGLWGLNAYLGYSATGGFQVAAIAEPDIAVSSEKIIGAKAFLRWKQTFGETEIAATVLWSSSQQVVTIGTDIKGQLGVGFWLEAAVFLPYETSNPPPQATLREVTFQGVFGIDYSFPVLDGLTVLLQYYYNHAGLTSSAKYPFNTTDGRVQFDILFNLLYAQSRNPLAASTPSPFNPGNFAGLGTGGGFFGAHYLLFSAQLTFLEDFRISLFALSNLLDPSFTFGPGFSWNFLSNFTLSLTAYFSLGPKDSEFAPGPRSVVVRIDGQDVTKEVYWRPLATVFAQFRFNF